MRTYAQHRQQNYSRKKARHPLRRHQRECLLGPWGIPRSFYGRNDHLRRCHDHSLSKRSTSTKKSQKGSPFLEECYSFARLTSSAGARASTLKEAWPSRLKGVEVLQDRSSRIYKSKFEEVNCRNRLSNSFSLGTGWALRPTIGNSEIFVTCYASYGTSYGWVVTLQKIQDLDSVRMLSHSICYNRVKLGSISSRAKILLTYF